MTAPPATTLALVLAEMITHDHVWRGVGGSEAEARAALLSAWVAHRAQVLSHQPSFADRLPVPEAMERHFRIRCERLVAGAGYRDGVALVGPA
ncbi:hypothetical protein C7444_11473 [Sphaerotilus hippei]|uniref:Uncharacterized protein n=1 Tax=Sphaerotilus hippei TaxID=744406 RepID=A0A318GXE8_9BURK|nr:hypothetical protein [Sphaerotilus hippei]PXW94374.1 hypothetical protein C7444_11473 [Sphaerotilus hippei]